MKNNKLISALLVLLVCLSLVVSVSAADSAKVESPLAYTVEASASTVKPGDSVTVTVGVAENTGFYFALLSLKYDPDLFVIDETTVVMNTEDYGDNISVGTKAKGIITVTIGGNFFSVLADKNAPKYEKNGMLIKATFTVKEDVTEDVISLFSLTANAGDLLVDRAAGMNGFAKKVDIDIIKNANIVSPDHDCADHKPAVIPAVDPDCVNTGLTEGTCCPVCYTVLKAQEEVEALGHTGGQATCYSLAVCDRCGESYGETLDHAWAWVTDKAATLTDTGLKHQECTNEGCDAVQNENTVIEMLTCEHQMTKTEKVDVTCDADGMNAYWTCSVCKRIYSDEAGQLETTLEELVIKTEGHKYENVDATPPTCTEDGKKAGVICSVCGDVQVAQETDPAIGHAYGEWEVSKEATTKAPGEEKCVCANCGDVQTREIPQKEPLISTPVIIALVVAGIAAAALVAVLVIRKKKLLHR